MNTTATERDTYVPQSINAVLAEYDYTLRCIAEAAQHQRMKGDATAGGSALVLFELATERTGDEVLRLLSFAVPA